MSSLILASASPQRKTLLEGIGLSFSVIPSRVPEEMCTESDPTTRAVHLAREKALDVGARHRGEWIIGCDTLVVAPNGTLLEKPKDAKEAHQMLMLQSGGTSVVHSGLALLSPAGVLVDGLSSSQVTFKVLSSMEMDWWVGTQLWQGRSGAFQIDGLGQLMIERIEGDWTGIVGFPVFLFGTLAKEAGLEIAVV